MIINTFELKFAIYIKCLNSLTHSLTHSPSELFTLNQSRHTVSAFLFKEIKGVIAVLFVIFARHGINISEIVLIRNTIIAMNVQTLYHRYNQCHHW